MPAWHWHGLEIKNLPPDTLVESLRPGGAPVDSCVIRGRCKCQARRGACRSRDPAPPRGQGGRVDPWDNPGAVRAPASPPPPLFMVLSPVNPPNLPEPPLGPRPPTHVHAPTPRAPTYAVILRHDSMSLHRTEGRGEGGYRSRLRCGCCYCCCCRCMLAGCCCCCCCCCCCWQRHMVYICSSNTTVQLYMYRECLGIPSQCFFMPKKCPKKTSLPMPVSTVTLACSAFAL
eukprot:COSAG01_NODE_215_length_21709_cov_141.101217_31_plen_230_part_00